MFNCKLNRLVDTFLELNIISKIPLFDADISMFLKCYSESPQEFSVERVELSIIYVRGGGGEVKSFILVLQYIYL